nr:MAG TPA: hypothetical protein [Caudoviricetes sp.]
MYFHYHQLDLLLFHLNWKILLPQQSSLICKERPAIKSQEEKT